MVLAAGKGTRLQPLTLTTPKPIVPIANVPLLEHTLSWLSSQGVTEVTVNLYHLAERIEAEVGDGARFGLRVYYSPEEELLGTSGGLKRCAHAFEDEPFFVIYGDSLFSADLSALLEKHRRSEAIATIGLFDAPNITACGMVVTGEAGAIARFHEKPRLEEVVTHQANAGVYVLEPRILRFIPDWVSDFGMDIFPALLNAGEKLCGFLLGGYMQDTGTPHNYRKANWDVLSGIVSAGKGRIVSTETGSALIGDNAEIASDVRLIGQNIIGERVQIGAGASLKDCILWDEASVGDGVSLECAVLGYGAVVDGSMQVTSGMIIN